MIKNKKIYFSLFMFFLFFLFSLFIYHQTLEKNLNDEMADKVNEVALQNTKAVQKAINNNFTLLDETKNHIMNAYYHNGEFEVDNVIDEMNSVVSRQVFFRLGIVLKDGTTYSTREENSGILERTYVQEALKGNHYISDAFEDHITHKPTIVFSAPLYDGENLIGAIFMGYDASELRNEISMSSFDDEGYSYIIKTNGDAVIDSTHESSFHNLTNFYESLYTASPNNEDCVLQLKRELGSKAEGYFIFNNKIDKYCYYTSLDIKDWYLLTIVPRQSIEQLSRTILMTTILFFLVLYALFSFLIFALYKFMREKNKELEKIVYEDKVTHDMSYQKFLKEEPYFFANLKYDEHAAFIFLDINNFKLINDLYGVEHGDKILCFISQTIKNNINKTDIFARLYGDEFIILTSYKNRKELEQRILNIKNFIRHESRTHNNYVLKALFGIYEVLNIHEDYEYMQNCAKIAHKNIKQKKDIYYLFYNDDMRTHLLHNKKLEDKITQAIEDNEFIAYYQPQFDTFTKKVVGAEALIRWKKKDNTVLSPFHFIDIAEATGLIITLDELIFIQVCKKIRHLLDHKMNVVPVSVNISKKTLYDSQFISKYKSHIKEFNIPPNLIQLELTESLIMVDKNRTNEIIDQLHEIGLKIFMDDFGTGYSSLLMLKDIPIDILKLDKSFIDDYQDLKSSQILKATIKLAHALNMHTVAEGVETLEQYEYLKELKCEVIQGYYFSKPLSEEDYIELLQK